MSKASISLIICTKSRCAQLANALRVLNEAELASLAVEILVIDNNSNDATKTVVSDFKTVSKFPVRYLFCEDIGLGNARNIGVQYSESSWIVFTDDDCYVDKNYFVNFEQASSRSDFDYGSGQVLPYENDADPRIASLVINSTQFIEPYSQFLTAGSVQGANMFFKREIFGRAGNFNPLMGAGTPFACEDIEMAARASACGFVGVQLPECIVYHHHGRRLHSKEADETVKTYDYGRGAYYASIFHLGNVEIWDAWKSSASLYGYEPEIARHLRELEGAAKYLETILKGSILISQRKTACPVNERELKLMLSLIKIWIANVADLKKIIRERQDIICTQDQNLTGLKKIIREQQDIICKQDQNLTGLKKIIREQQDIICTQDQNLSGC
ncbi:MAG: glycosyltransferase [Methylocystis sp.]